MKLRFTSQSIYVYDGGQNFGLLQIAVLRIGT
jgi:hypothetical protein